MAGLYLENLTELAAPDQADILYIVDSPSSAPAGRKVTLANLRRLLNDEIMSLGTGQDVVLVERSSALLANTALTGVLIGIPVSAATPADSLLISNTTANGDIAVFLNDGSGNSWEWDRFDSSQGLRVFNEAGNDIDHRWEADVNASLLILDAGAYSGQGALGFGPVSTITPFNVAPTARTASNAQYSHAYISAGGIVTAAASPTLMVTLTLEEPNISGSPTSAATFYIQNAPTEGTSRNHAVWVDAGTTRLDGGVLVGATDSADALISTATSGTGTTTTYIGNQTINTTSDMRVKEDIVTWADSASELLRLGRLVEFTYVLPGGGTRDGYGPNGRGRYLGFLAQETIAWAPWAINAGNAAGCQRCRAGLKCSQHEHYWHAEYQHLVPLVIRGWQEHDGRLLSLETENAILRERVAALEGPAQ